MVEIARSNCRCRATWRKLLRPMSTSTHRNNHACLKPPLHWHRARARTCMACPPHLLRRTSSRLQLRRHVHNLAASLCERMRGHCRAVGVSVLRPPPNATGKCGAPHCDNDARREQLGNRLRHGVTNLNACRPPFLWVPCRRAEFARLSAGRPEQRGPCMAASAMKRRCVAVKAPSWRGNGGTTES